MQRRFGVVAQALVQWVPPHGTRKVRQRLGLPAEG